jgi:hypothetical protein
MLEFDFTGFTAYIVFSFENTPMHRRGVLFGRGAFGRVGVDFAWNVRVIKIGDSGARVAKGAILRRANNGRAVGAVWIGNGHDAGDVGR